MSIGGGGEALPPLVQVIKTDANQALSEQDKFVQGTKNMADRSEESSSRASSGFASIAKGVAVGELAVKAFSAAMDGVRKVIEVGIDKVKEDSVLQSQLAAGIQSTGNAANVSVDGMNALAKSISLMSGQTDDSIAKTESLLLTFTNIKNQGPDKIFDQATQAAADMAARMGGDASASAIQLGKALNDPVAGITALTRVGVSFTDQQKQQIAAMVAAGNTIGAQKMILGELNKEFGGSAAAAGATFPGAIARAKMALEDMAGSVVSLFEPVVLPVLNLAATAAAHLSDAFDGAIGPIQGAMEKAGDAFKSFVDGFKNGTDAIGSDQSIFAAFGARAYEVFTQIKGLVGPIFNQIGTTIKQLAPVFAPLIGQVLQLASSFSPLHLAFEAVAPIIPQIVQAVGQLAGSLAGTLGQTLTTIIPVIQSVAQTLVGVLSTALKALLPVLPVIVDALGKVASVLGGALASTIKIIGPIITQLVGILGPILGTVLKQLAPIIAELAKTLGGLLASAIQAIAPFIGELAKFLGQVLVAVLPLIKPILDLVMAFLPLLDPIIQLVSVLLKPLVDLLTMILGPVMDLVSGLVKFLAPAIEVVVEGLAKNLMPIIQAVTQILGGVIDFLVGVFTGNWSKAWKGIVEIFTGIWNGIKGVVEGVINTVIDLINGIIAGINNVAKGVKDATGGAINLSIGKIPRVSFDVGTNRVPGPTGAPLPATVHGGEVILSNDSLSGNAPIPQRAVDAVRAQDARSGVASGPQKVISITQVNHQHTSTRTAASELGWLLKMRG